MSRHIRFREPFSLKSRPDVWSRRFQDEIQSKVSYAVFSGCISTFQFPNDNGCMFLNAPDGRLSAYPPNPHFRIDRPPVSANGRKLLLILSTNNKTKNEVTVRVQQSAALLLASGDIPEAFGDIVKVTFWGRRSDSEIVNQRNIFSDMRVLHTQEVEFVTNEWIFFLTRSHFISMITVEYSTKHMLKHLLFGEDNNRILNIMRSIDPLTPQ